MEYKGINHLGKAAAGRGFVVGGWWLFVTHHYPLTTHLGVHGHSPFAIRTFDIIG
jgi:hypothetical protein